MNVFNTDSACLYIGSFKHVNLLRNCRWVELEQWIRLEVWSQTSWQCFRIPDCVSSTL